MDKPKLLKSCYLFSTLADTLLESVARSSTIRRFDKDQVVILEGDPGDSLFVIADGLVRVYVGDAENGRELTLAFLEIGDAFGEIALLDGQPRTASVVAAEETTLVELKRAAFFDCVRELPGFAEQMFELICERFRNTLTDLNSHVFADLRRRLANKLVSLAMAHGRIDGDQVVFERRFSQQELAQLLGVSREAVNRQLSAWVKNDILSIKRTGLEIQKLSEIQKLATNLG